MVIYVYSEYYHRISGMMKLIMKKNLLGAIIGFASDLYIASALNKVISRNSFAADLDGAGFILLRSIIIGSFSIFGRFIESQIIIIQRIWGK